MRDLTIYLSLGRSKLFEFRFMNLNFITIIFLLLIFLTRGNFAVGNNQVSSASLGDLCALAVNSSSSRTTTGSISQIIPTQTQTFTVNDRLTTDTYDANGNTLVSKEGGTGVSPVSSSSVTDIYSFDNKLIRRTTPDGKTIDLTYSPDGHRLTKFITQNGLTQRLVHYLTDSNNPTGYAQVVEEKQPLDTASPLKKVNLYGHDLISSEERSTGVSPTSSIYYTYDGLGSVRSITDTTGNLQETYDYDAYGTLIGLAKRNPVSGLLESSNLSSTIPDLQSEYLFTGEQWDADLGMYFLRARYLNTNTGRFYTQDSYEGSNGEPQTLHKYLYANANPISYTDPSGQISLQEVGITLGITTSLGAITGGTYGYALSGTISGAAEHAVTGAAFGLIGGTAVIGGGLGIAAATGVSEATGMFIAGTGLNVLGVGVEGYKLATTTNPRHRVASGLAIAFSLLGQGLATGAYLNAQAGKGTFTSSSQGSAEENAVGRWAADYYGADIVGQNPTGAGRTPDYKIMFRGKSAELKNLSGSGENSVVSQILSAQSDNVIVIVKPGQLSQSFLARLGGRIFGPNAPGSPKSSVTVISDDGSGYNLMFLGNRNGSNGLNR
jgi:RHS repeat-associated protein